MPQILHYCHDTKTPVWHLYKDATVPTVEEVDAKADKWVEAEVNKKADKSVEAKVDGAYKWLQGLQEYKAGCDWVKAVADKADAQLQGVQQALADRPRKTDVDSTVTAAFDRVDRAVNQGEWREAFKNMVQDRINALEAVHRERAEELREIRAQIHADVDSGQGLKGKLLEATDRVVGELQAHQAHVDQKAQEVAVHAQAAKASATACKDAQERFDSQQQEAVGKIEGLKREVEASVRKAGEHVQAAQAARVDVEKACTLARQQIAAQRQEALDQIAAAIETARQQATEAAEAREEARKCAAEAKRLADEAAARVQSIDATIRNEVRANLNTFWRRLVWLFRGWPA